MTSDIHIARYWDRIQGSKFDVHQVADGLHRIFKKRGVRRILDLGCGTGSLLLSLARRNYECMGIDMDPHMLAEGRRKARIDGLAVEFRAGDLRRLELAETFDAVLSFQVFSLLRGCSDVGLALEGIGNILTEGGLLAFDVLESRETKNGTKNGACPLFIDTVLKTEEGSVVRLNRMTEIERSLQWQAVYFFQEGGQVKMGVRSVPLVSYSEEEMTAMLHQCGFAVLRMDRHDAGGPGRRNVQILAAKGAAGKGGKPE